jgi:hypothetical protein
MLGAKSHQARTEEPRQITSNRAIALIAREAKASFRTDDLLPPKEQVLGLKASIAESGFCTADGLFGQSQVRKRGQHGSTSGQKSPREQGEQQMEQSQVGSNWDTNQNLF